MTNGTVIVLYYSRWHQQKGHIFHYLSAYHLHLAIGIIECCDALSVGEKT
jgi:hypothetical protein